MSLPSAFPDRASHAGSTSRADTRLRGPWLAVARGGWVVTALITVGLDIFAIPVFRAQILIPCSSGTGTRACLYAQLTTSQLRTLQAMGVSLSALALYLTALVSTVTLAYVAVAAIIFWRRSNDSMACFASFMLVVFGGAAVSGTLQALPAVSAAWFVPVNALDTLGQVTFILFFLLFPDGHFVPRWTRWLSVLYAAAWMTSFFPGSLPDTIGSNLRNGPGFPVLVLCLVGAQIYRYRRVSNARQRQQTKWVVYGFTLGLTGFALIISSGHLLPPSIVSDPLGTLAVTSVIDVLFILIPLSIAVAMLRSRLYDIDVLINRTLVYGALTALLAATYFGAVIGFQALAQALTGVASLPPLVLVASTLLLVVLFNPLRRRLQMSVDRRFYRRKYDAAKTLATFGATLRSEIDPRDLSDHLLAVVDETMQPAHVSLWLRLPERHPTAQAHHLERPGQVPPTLSADEAGMRTQRVGAGSEQVTQQGHLANITHRL